MKGPGNLRRPALPEAVSWEGAGASDCHCRRASCQGWLLLSWAGGACPSRLLTGGALSLLCFALLCSSLAIHFSQGPSLLSFVCFTRLSLTINIHPQSFDLTAALHISHHPFPRLFSFLLPTASGVHSTGHPNRFIDICPVPTPSVSTSQDAAGHR